MRELHADFLRRGDEWENPTLDRFLEALAAWINEAPGAYRCNDEEPSSIGDLTFFARALTAAAVYE